MGNKTMRDLGEVLRDEMVMRDKILKILADGPKTVPEIAEALEYPSSDVMFWVMAMWRYGSLEEVGKRNDEGYYKYRPVK